MSSLIPIVNAGLSYVNGLELSRTDDAYVAVAAGAARDSSNVVDIVVGSALAINGGAVGANGVDLAVLANSSMYAVYVIADSTKYNDPAGLLSLASNAAPTMPAGYDVYRRVGWVLTDGTADLLAFVQFGSNEHRSYYYDVAISELSGGASATYAAVDLATSVPPIATRVMLDVAYTPNSATNLLSMIPGASAATAGIVRYGYGVAAAQVGSVVMPCDLVASVPTIKYKVGNSSDAVTLLVAGFEDNL